MIKTVNDTIYIKGQFLITKQSQSDYNISLGPNWGCHHVTGSVCVGVCVSKTELMRVCMCVEGRI